jgi:transcriptional regulator with GAF, ATPase, and Fis domain
MSADASDPGSLHARLRALTARESQVAADGDPLQALHDIVAACVDLLEVTGGGIMLVDEMGVSHYVAASDQQGRLLEKVEAEAMEGPCTDALVHNGAIHSPDLRTETRWPTFRAALADQAELRAVVGVPVRVGAIPVGTLDVFLDRSHAWSDAQLEAVRRLGDLIGTVLGSALEAHHAGVRAEQLQYALDYRIVIERGVGYLMARDRLDAVSAFNRLRATARDRRTKAGRVAQHLLDTGRLPGE